MPVYKDNERGTWYAAFYYTDWTGEKKKKKKRGFKKRADALEFEREFLSKQSMSCDMSFKSLVELYYEDKSTRARKTTMNSKKTVIDKQIVPYFQDLAVNQIKATTVRKWQNQLLESNYSPTYINYIHTQLSAIFNFAVQFYDLKENPARKAGSIGKKAADAMQFWTLEEFNQFIGSITDLALKTAYTLLFYSGMRCGELLALTPNDFNLRDSTVSITKSFSRLDKEDIINEPKTPKSKRIVTLPKFVTELVTEYLQTLYGLDDTERIFPHTKYYLQNNIAKYATAAGVKKIRVHDIRHSHASLLIEMGINIILISERLGHEKIQTTLDTYSHLYPNKHEEVAEQLDMLKKGDA